MRLLFVRYFKNWRVQVFPTICIILYILFTVTDLYTTYLSTPNLKSESNPVYQCFKWGWSGHLLYISAMVLMTITFAVISNNYIHKYFINKNKNIPVNGILFVISLFLLIYCFHNLIATFECSINNYLGYRYTYVISESKIQKLSVSYVRFYLDFNQQIGGNFFMYIVTFIEIILATFITFLQTNRVKKYVKSTFPA